MEKEEEREGAYLQHAGLSAQDGPRWKERRNRGGKHQEFMTETKEEEKDQKKQYICYIQSLSLAGLRLGISFRPFLRALTLLGVESTFSHCFFSCFNSAKAPIFVNASIALTHKTAPVALVGWRATAKEVGREGEGGG